jgi:hypothetical protein
MALHWYATAPIHFGLVRAFNPGDRVPDSVVSAHPAETTERIVRVDTPAQHPTDVLRPLLTSDRDTDSERERFVPSRLSPEALRAAFGSPDDVGYDLILLIGQSNMSGRGVPYNARTDPADSRVWQYGASGTYAGVISQAVEPLAQHDTPTGIGPGLGFARWYAASAPTSRRVLLVPAAHGGTALSSGALLGWRRSVPGGLYSQALSQARAALTAAGPNARIVAALWLQGETDGTDGTSGTAYQVDLDILIAGLRSDLGIPGLPFVIGQMVPDYLDTGTRTAINAVHAAAPSRLPRVAFSRAPFGQHLGDGNHFNSAGQRVIGRRMFDAFRRILTGTADPEMPEAPAAVAGLTIGAPTATSVPLSWTAGARAEAYAVEYKTTAGSTWTRVTADTGTAFTITGLAPATDYEVRVLSINASGLSAPTSSVPASTGAVPVGAIIFTDSFNRADVDVLTATETPGKSWQAVITAGTTATAGIRSNQMAPIYTTSGGNLNEVVECGTADGTLTAVVPVINASLRLAARVQDDLNYLAVVVADTSVQLRKYVAGASTTVGTGTIPAGVPKTVAVVLNGTSVSVLVGGMQVINPTPVSEFAAATKHGVQMAPNAGLPGARIDSIEFRAAA